MVKQNKYLRDILIIFLIGIFFRLFLVVYIAATNPYGWQFFNNPMYQGSDQGDFFRLVKNIVENHVFSFSADSPFQLDQFRTPLFPLFMSFSYWLTGGFWLFLVLNILVSSGIGVVTYQIARQLFDNQKLAYWSGIIFNLLPYGAYLSLMAMADNLFALFFTLFILFTLKFFKNRQHITNLMFSGIFLAVATLTRPIPQYLVIIGILFLLFSAKNWWQGIRWAIIFGLSFIIIGSPWLVRNYLVFRQPVFSSLGGYHMFVSWIGPYRAYIKDRIPRSQEAQKIFQYIKDKYGKYGSEAMYDPDISAKLGKEAKNEILHNLSTYLPFHIFSGAIFYMNNDVLLTLGEVFKINSGNIYAFERLFHFDLVGFLKNLLQLNWLYIIVYLGSYLLIFGKNILALIGIKRYWRILPLVALFILFIFIYFPLLVGPEGHARFRYPLESLLIIFALSVFLVGKENSKNKLIYIVNARIPTEKAHGIQIMNMCSALAANGAEVELILPARANEIKRTPFDYYGLLENFKIRRLPVIDLISWNLPFTFILETITFFVSVFVYLIFQPKDYVIYTRGEVILGLSPFLKVLKRDIFWETHIKPDNIYPYQRLFSNIKGFITVTKYYQNELIEKYDILVDKTFRAPDGVDLEKFDILTSREDARKKLRLPMDKKIILYAGSLIPWKGADILKEGAKLLPNDILLVILAGGEKEDIEKFKKIREKKILFLEHRSPNEIPYYLKSADILILTGTKQSDISIYYTSPLKLFEYMASGRPILAADILSFREVLNDSNAFFYEADNVKSLVDKINYIFTDYQLAQDKTQKALADVRDYSWKKRAENILKFMNL